MLNYNIVGNMITIILDGKIHHISRGDIRFKTIYPLLKKDALSEDKARDILNYSDVLDKDVSVKNGKFCLGKREIEIRDDLILVAQDNFKSLKNLVYNMENHEQFDKQKTVEVYLENKNTIRDFSSDGMRFLINGSVSRDLHNTPFYKAKITSPYLLKVMDKYPDYKTLLKEVFGLSGKKFLATFDSIFFNEDKKEINLDVINLLRGIKGYFDLNKTQELLELAPLYRGLKETDAKILREWLDFYFPTNQKKAFNILVKNQTLPENMLKMFSLLKTHALLRDDISFIDLKKLTKEYKQTYDAYKEKFEEDEILVHFPNLKNIDGKEVLKGLFITYPKSSKDIAKWGKIMNNCFGGRARQFIQGQIVLFGLKDCEDRLQYVFEVVDGRFGDFEGRTKGSRGDRQRLGREIKADVGKFLSKHGFMSK